MSKLARIEAQKAQAMTDQAQVLAELVEAMKRLEKKVNELTKPDKAKAQ